METDQTQPVPQESKQPKRKGIKIVLISIIVVMLLGITALAVYMWQQQKINTLENKNTQLSSSITPSTNDNPKPAAALTTFKRGSVSLIFDYPKDWTVLTEVALDAQLPAPDFYTIKLAAPGSDIQMSGSGADFVKKGSRIVIYVSKTDLKDVSSAVSSKHTTDRKEITISGIKAVEYSSGYESDPAVNTALIKDGRSYTIAYYSDSENEKDNPTYPVYAALLKSIKFE